MIILDTNVLSALMQAEPDPRVIAWLDRQAPESLWISSITLFESRMGLTLLTEGRRRQTLEAAFEKLLSEDLQHRVLAFDAAAAQEAAIMAATRQRAGRVIDLRDTQIAGIATARRASIATRNVRHFQDLSVPVINPWD